MQEQNAPRDQTVLYHNTLSEGTYTANTFAISLNKKTSPISTPILSHHQSFFVLVIIQWVMSQVTVSRSFTVYI